MPQCVAFDYFGVDCVLRPEPSSSIGAPEKAGAHILRQFLGPQNYTLTTAHVQRVSA